LVKRPVPLSGNLISLCY